ncbi:MAG TPA: type II secretion system protein N [Gammaproteobacteria bacterium]|nr:type II secretion system protein N [Gammaproteobacteria bacterium]
MMRIHLRAWSFGIAAFLVFLLADLPASYLTPWLSRHFPALQLSGVSGSMFSGQAESVRFGANNLGAVAWSFDWLAPFTATLGYRVHLHDEARDLDARVDAGLGSLKLRDIRGRVTVASLDQWLPLPSHSAGGTLFLDLKQLQLKNGHLQSASGQVELDDGSLSWPSPYTLGSYRMNLEPASGGGITAEITDLAAPLKLHADLSLATDGHYHLAGTLAARDQGDTATRKLLANLGNPDSTGQYPFDFKGQW